MRCRDASGFSLIEAVVACGLMAGALAALGQLFAISIANNRAAQAGSYATVLAQQKVEELRDTELISSPPGTLASNTDGWVDYIDDAGSVLGGGSSVRPGAVYVRRWAIDPLPSNPAETIIIQVFVTTVIGRGTPGARLLAVRTRTTP
jgi:type II secretory pathway pseudopilin PulG